jgi:rubrerythrin
MMLATAILSAWAARAVAQPAAPTPAKTIANLNAAMQDEANAAHRYLLFARRADEEGHREIAKLFRAVAQSELVHEQNHRKAIAALGGKAQEVELAAVAIGSTRENLERPLRREAQEAGERYPEFMEQARRDEAEAAYRSFRWARDAEAKHAKLFARALRDLGSNPPIEYYVGVRTGDVVTDLPREPTEEYVKVQ